MINTHPASPAAISSRLERLADEMEDVGACMDYYGGIATIWAQHGREMIGAAAIARQLAEAIKETGDDFTR